MTDTTTTATPSHRLQVRVDDRLASLLEQRAETFGDGSPDRAARADVVQLHDVLSVTLGRSHWTLRQLAAVAESQLATQPDRTVGGFVADLACAAHFAREDGDEETAEALSNVVARLRSEGPALEAALCAAVHLWHRSHHEHTVDGWAAAGVRAVEASGATDA